MNGNGCGWEIPSIFTAFVILHEVYRECLRSYEQYAGLEKALNYDSYTYAVHVCVQGYAKLGLHVTHISGNFSYIMS